MIKAIIGNNLSRSQYILDPNTTIRSAIEQAELEYGAAMLSLDGKTVNGPDLDKTFADHGYDGSAGHDKCYLIAVIKSDNAR